MALQLPNSLGPWQPKVTRIRQLWVQPCNVNPFIWVAGYFAASPVILFNILSPDCLDYTADRVRRGHRRRRKMKWSITDHSDPINLKGDAAGWFAFKGLQLAQRVGWYFLIADATLDWVIHGTSFAYQWSGCEDPNAPRATLEMENKVPLLLPATTSRITQWDVKEAVILTAGPAGIASPKGIAAGVGFTLTQNMFRHPPLQDCNWTARVVDLISGTSYGPFDPVTQPNGNRAVTWASPVTGTADETHNWTVVVTKDFGVFDVSGNFTASGTDLAGISKSACGHSIGGI